MKLTWGAILVAAENGFLVGLFRFARLASARAGHVDGLVLSSTFLVIRLLIVRPAMSQKDLRDVPRRASPA